jgi:prepilin-type N-terminal cleavage/methylation domain-containing protein
MKPRAPRFQGRANAGFTAIELMIVLAMIGVIMALAVPSFISFFRSSALRSAAEETAAALNRARQLAIRDNRSMCVTTAGGRLQIHIATCAGTVWTGPGTDAAGLLPPLANNLTVASAQPEVTFNYIGTATAPALPVVYTVTNAQDGSTSTVSVAASGRVSLGP